MAQTEGYKFEMDKPQQICIAEFDYYEQNSNPIKIWLKNLKIKNTVNNTNELLVMKFVTNPEGKNFVTLLGLAIRAYIEGQDQIEKLVEGDKIEFLAEEIVQTRVNDNDFKIINPTGIKKI